LYGSTTSRPGEDLREALVDLRRLVGAAGDTPPFLWQDRGTYHQIDELTGHR
jgi:hypothetical protein